MTERLQTGIPQLDRKLGGGIPAGSLVLVSASPSSQSEQFFCDLSGGRRTLYLTTSRSRGIVERSLRQGGAPMDDVAVREIGDSPLEETYALTRVLDRSCNVVVDPLFPLERADESRFVDFLNAFQRHLVDTGSLAFFHGLDARSVPPCRDVTEHAADVVFEFTVDVTNGRMNHLLHVPKYRDGAPIDETITLELDGGVSIDTSRDIA